MPEYKPRNCNERTREAPKSTSRWFDDRREDRRNPKLPCGFRENDQ